MVMYARIENGVAVEVIDTGDYAIDQLFAPAFVAAMVQVPEGVSVEIGAPMPEAARAIEPLREPQSPVIAQPPMVEDKEPLAAERVWRSPRSQPPNGKSPATATSRNWDAEQR